MASHSASDREYLMGVAEDLLAGVFSHYKDGVLCFPVSPAAGYPSLLGMRSSEDEKIETFVRSFMVAVPLLVNNPYVSVAGHSVRNLFVTMLPRHTDPKSPDYFVTGNLEPSQVTVEAALLALGILETNLLSYLTKAERTQVIHWFETLANAPVLANNWLWFRVFINVFLRKVGGRARDCYGDMHAIKDMHYTGGWFLDGTKFDLYSAWSMQFWPAFLMKYDDTLSAEDREYFNATTNTFLKSYSHFFSRDGKSLPWGRSQIYRFASAAPFAVAFNSDKITFDAGFARQIVVNNVKRFMEQPGVFVDGLLTLGFLAEDASIVDPYSCVASPMWAAKTLWCLNLPDTNPFWSAAPSSGFWSSGVFKPTTLPAGMTLTESNGEVTLDYDQTVIHGGHEDNRYYGPFTTDWSIHANQRTDRVAD